MSNIEQETKEHEKMLVNRIQAQLAMISKESNKMRVLNGQPREPNRLSINASFMNIMLSLSDASNTASLLFKRLSAVPIDTNRMVVTFSQEETAQTNAIVEYLLKELRIMFHHYSKTPSIKEKIELIFSNIDSMRKDKPLSPDNSEEKGLMLEEELEIYKQGFEFGKKAIALLAANHPELALEFLNAIIDFDKRIANIPETVKAKLQVSRD